MYDEKAPDSENATSLRNLNTSEKSKCEFLFENLFIFDFQNFKVKAVLKFFWKISFYKTISLYVLNNENKHRIRNPLVKAVIFHYFSWIFDHSNPSNGE